MSLLATTLVDTRKLSLFRTIGEMSELLEGILAIVRITSSRTKRPTSTLPTPCPLSYPTAPSWRGDTHPRGLRRLTREIPLPGVDSLPRHGERLAVVLPPEPQQERDGGLGPLRRTQVVAGLLAEGAAEHRGVDDARVEGDGGQALGSSWARASVRPSIAHFEAQYGATSGETERPQYELRLTITPAIPGRSSATHPGPPILTAAASLVPFRGEEGGRDGAWQSSK